MDPNPNSFPIVSYVMSRLQSLKAGTIGPSSPTYGDIEQGASKFSRPSSHELQLVIDRMPHLQHPDLLASMAAAISDVAKTRSALQYLGDRPDHESVDIARSRIAAIDDDLSQKIEDIIRSPVPENYDHLAWRAELEERERICREAADTERAALRAVIELDEMHESYEKLLKEAEERLEKMYLGSTTKTGVETEKLDDGEKEEKGELDEEVVRILQEGAEKGVERVELIGRQLRILPEAVGKLRGLISLNVSKNQLEVIPDAISGLEYLEELRLSSNNLISLPDSIGLLLNLKVLVVSSNKLKSLPNSISKCRSLVELDASYNELAYLPTNMGFELSKLEKLCIQLNKLRSLPSSICEMQSLRILDAHFNELRGLPHAIGKLKKLEILNVSSNFSDLTELPASFGELTNLQELDLSNNQIHALPDSFGRLDKLIKLNLDQNPLEVPPAEIVKDGVVAVKEYMSKRWVDMLLEEERKSVAEEEPVQSNAGWLTRSTSWLNSWVAGSVSGVMDRSKSFKDPYLDREM